MMQHDAARVTPSATTIRSARLPALAMLLACAAPSMVWADDQDVIDYRQHIMNTLGAQAAALDMILKNKAPADGLAAHAKALAVVAATAKKAFETKVAGGNAKPEVWANWADFAKRLDTLASSSTDLSNAAQAGGVNAAVQKAYAALPCKDCHDKYRVPPK